MDSFHFLLYCSNFEKQISPTLQHHSKSKQKKGRGKTKRNSATSDTSTSLLPQIPACPCGAQRLFECQLMPTTLHFLNVDHYATSSCTSKASSSKNKQQDSSVVDDADLEFGGMNWGVIAIYSCADSCNESREEVCVIQASVDDVPSFQKKQVNQIKINEKSDEDDEKNDL